MSTETTSNPEQRAALNDEVLQLGIEYQTLLEKLWAQEEGSEECKALAESVDSAKTKLRDLLNSVDESELEPGHIRAKRILNASHEANELFAKELYEYPHSVFRSLANLLLRERWEELAEQLTEKVEKNAALFLQARRYGLKVEVCFAADEQKQAA